MDVKNPYEKRLAEAKQQAKKRIEAEKQAEQLDEPEGGYTSEECLLQLHIFMLVTGSTLGMGILPDGMAFYVRIRVPSKADDPRAGKVAFLAASDPTSALNKAVHALSSAKSDSYWKPDRFANA